MIYTNPLNDLYELFKGFVEKVYTNSRKAS